MVGIKSLGDIMKNQRNILRKRLKKNLKKKIKRLKRTKDKKQHEWNFDKIKRDIQKINKTRGVGNA
tara:strand:- start:19 stop:216 length:198 start_codon:yes stop_codon:yes gene_type:complete